MKAKIETQTAHSALQAAHEWGGWSAPQDAGIAEEEIRGHFTADNFARMYPGEDPEECGGYTLAECAQAVIAWQAEAESE